MDMVLLFPRDVTMMIYRLIHNDLMKRLRREYHYHVYHADSHIEYKKMFWTYRQWDWDSMHNIYNISHHGAVSLLPTKYWFTSGCVRLDGYFDIATK